MRLLLIHASRFKYRALREAIRPPLEEGGDGEFGDCLVCFTTVEEGDGEPEVVEASNAIAEQAERIGVDSLPILPPI